MSIEKAVIVIEYYRTLGAKKPNEFRSLDKALKDDGFASELAERVHVTPEALRREVGEVLGEIQREEAAEGVRPMNWLRPPTPL